MKRHQRGFISPISRARFCLLSTLATVFLPANSLYPRQVGGWERDIISTVMKSPRILSLLALTCATSAHAAVVLDASATVPTTIGASQSTLVDDATIPGGTPPGGGTYNSQVYSDNSGPPGQTFTTASSSATGYYFNSFSFKGAAAGAANYGNFAANTTWGIRISSVVGSTLSPLVTVTGIVHPLATAAGDSWYTWTFSGADRLILNQGSIYAFEAYSSAGYLGFDAATDPASYAGGNAFNTTSTARTFSNATLVERGYDRTFVANLTAVPEPSAALLGLVGAALAIGRRRR